MSGDLQRLFDYVGEPHKFPSTFPTNSLTAMRALTAAAPADVPALALKVFKAYWAEDRNIADPAVLAELDRRRAGGEGLRRGRERKAQGRHCGSRPARAFGAPTFFVGDDMYFGEDRLFLIEHALKGS